MILILACDICVTVTSRRAFKIKGHVGVIHVDTLWIQRRITIGCNRDHTVHKLVCSFAAVGVEESYKFH